MKMIKKRLLIVLGTWMILLFSFNQVHAEKIDYQKYGSIAIAVVKADYPGDPVTDYQFLGREKLSETEVQDSFKFQVKENGKAINVVVKVKHSVKNNKLLSLTVEEVQ
jgi:hypothetical protein